MKPKNQSSSLSELATGEDDKVYKIVDEVDRFFKSVHADIEDWKFSMEDYGDGTRLFVRFQIHFDQSVVSPRSTASRGAAASRGETTDRKEILSVRGGRPESGGRKDAPALHDSDGDGATQRADQDLASFVGLWRRKRESNLHAEFHKPGAPFVDAPSDGNARTKGHDPPDGTGEATDDEPKVLDARR